MEPSRLDALVEVVTDKVTTEKDPTLPYVGLEHIATGSPDLLGTAPSSYSVSTNSVFAAGDTLYGKLRPNLRKAVIAPFAGYCSTDILVLRARECVVPTYAGRLFQSEGVIAAAVRTAMGTKMPRTSWTALRGLLVHRPALTAQRRIAEILDTLDESIRNTEQLIAKLKQVKQGLLHDLLTRGIDDNGELRDPARHPEQFKDSTLGRIPRKWHVWALEDCVSSEASITYGIVQAGPHVPGGIPYIRTGDMSSGKLSLEGLLRTSPRIAANYSRSRVQTGEIVCAIRATVGLVLLVPAELDGANLTQGTARIAPGKEANGVFLLWALRGNVVQHQFDLSVKGTTFREITLAQLRQLLVPVPADRIEQERIASAMTSIELREEREDAELAKLRVLKQGLMEDLLTGRVRVTNLLGEAAA